jgi:hypothetical protein
MCERSALGWTPALFLIGTFVCMCFIRLQKVKLNLHTCLLGWACLLLPAAVLSEAGCVHEVPLPSGRKPVPERLQPHMVRQCVSSGAGWCKHACNLGLATELQSFTGRREGAQQKHLEVPELSGPAC